MSNVNANMDHGHNMVDQNEGLSSQNASASNCNGNNANNNGFSGVPNNDLGNRTNDDSGNVLGLNMSASGNTLSSANQMSTSMSNSMSNSIPTFASSNNGDDVCRDFLRNVCRRGKACRFKHPDSNETEALGQRKDTYVFCHDYQNRECRRENCRFLHCSKQEEELFRNTGKLPSHVQAQIATEEWNSTPVCKDYMNGTCRRQPGRCKFRHPPEQSPMKRSSFNGRSSGFGASPPGMEYQAPYGGQQNSGTNMMSNYGYTESYPENPNKRKRYESMYSTQNGPYASAYTESMRAYGSIQSPSQAYYPPRGQPVDSRSYLEEENAALRRRIDELKKQVAELCTTNDYLLEQINQMRNATAPAAVAAVAAATSVASLQVPAPGTITSTATVIGTAPSAVHLQAAGVAPPPPPSAAVIGALPPSSIVSSIASISLPTVTAPVSLVNSSAAASLASYTPALHSTTQWPLGVDQ